MKNIVFPQAAEGSAGPLGPTGFSKPDGAAVLMQPLRVSRRIRSMYGNWPLLIWLFSQGLPLGKSLEPAKPALIEEVYARSIELTSQANSLNSGFQAAFLGTLYLWGALVVLARLPRAMLLLRRQWPLALLVLYVGASALWSHNSEKVLLNTVHNCGAMLIALAAALRYQNDPWHLPRDIGYALGLNILLQVGSVVLLPSYAIDWEGRWTGLTGQANTVGVLALCAFWANIAASIGRPASAEPRIFSIALALAAVLAMAGANSVTSMLSAACMLAITVRLRQGGGRLLSVAILVVVPVVSILVVTLSSILNLSSILGMAGRSGDFSGRTTIWADGFLVIGRQPWLGWSFDDHAYVIRTTDMQYTTYHNGYLDLGVAGGLLAILLLFALLVTATLQLNRPLRIGGALRACILPFMLALLIYNTTEGSFVAPRNAFWMIFITLTLLGAGRRMPEPDQVLMLTRLQVRYRQ